MSTPRVLTVDLETAPNLAHTWGLWQQNIGLPQLLVPGRVIGFGAKWHGDKRVIWKSEFHDTHEEMILSAHGLLDEADIVVHFNGLTFDMPWFRSEFVLAGLRPPAPSLEVDLLQVVKRQFRFPSNKLAYVTKALGLSGKLSHTGHEMWVKCLEGDEKAWALMRRYCKQDVATTEELYDRLLKDGWIKNHPNITLFSDDETPRCPACASENLHRRGYSFTTISAFPRYQCQDCGKWSRGGKRERGAVVR
jgi:hypothetical protein